MSGFPRWQGQIAEPNPNEHVLAAALQGNLQLSPNFFLVLLTSYTHLFNTEPRFFDHFLKFPAKANGQPYVGVTPIWYLF